MPMDLVQSQAHYARRSSTVVVASSASKDKERADYVCDGTNDEEEISAAISSISSGRITLLEGTYNIQDDITVPDGVEIDFTNGALLNIQSGVTVTFNSTLDAPPIHIFSGDGNVSFGKQRYVYPEWWGAKGDGSTDDYTALQKACNYQFIEVRLNGTYRISQPLVLHNCTLAGSREAHEGAGILVDGNLGFTGDYAVSSWTGETPKQDGVNNFPYASLEHVTIYVKNISNTAFTVVYMDIAENAYIKNVSFSFSDTSCSIKTVLEVERGPALIDTVNLAYGSQNVTTASYPIRLNCYAGLVFRNLNYTMSSSDNPIWVQPGLFCDMSGLQIETHPPTADTPAMLVRITGNFHLRDSSFQTTIDNSRGIVLDTSYDCSYYYDFGIERVYLARASGASTGSYNRPISYYDGSTYYDLTQTELGTFDQNYIYILKFDRDGVRFAQHPTASNNCIISSGLSSRVSQYVGDVASSESFTIKINPSNRWALAYRADGWLVLITARDGTSFAARVALLLVGAAASPSAQASEIVWIYNPTVGTGDLWTASFSDGVITITNNSENTMLNVSYVAIELIIASYIW